MLAALIFRAPSSARDLFSSLTTTVIVTGSPARSTASGTPWRSTPPLTTTTKSSASRKSPRSRLRAPVRSPSMRWALYVAPTLSSLAASQSRKSLAAVAPLQTFGDR